MASRNMACAINVQGQGSYLNSNMFYSTEHGDYIGGGEETKFKMYGVRMNCRPQPFMPPFKRIRVLFLWCIIKLRKAKYNSILYDATLKVK